jgi:hypothetical protein
MELSILTKCNVVLAIYDPSEFKLSIYKSCENDSDFAKEGTRLYERFSDQDVSLNKLADIFSLLMSLRHRRKEARTRC